MLGSHVGARLMRENWEHLTTCAFCKLWAVIAFLAVIGWALFVIVMIDIQRGRIDAPTVADVERESSVHISPRGIETPFGGTKAIFRQGGVAITRDPARLCSLPSLCAKRAKKQSAKG